MFQVKWNKKNIWTETKTFPWIICLCDKRYYAFWQSNWGIKSPKNKQTNKSISLWIILLADYENRYSSWAANIWMAINSSKDMRFSYLYLPHNIGVKGGKWQDVCHNMVMQMMHVRDMHLMYVLCFLCWHGGWGYHWWILVMKSHQNVISDW